MRDPLIEGFSHFVTSMTAPIASGWSGCRVGLAPTGKRRLCTAHANNGRRVPAGVVLDSLAKRVDKHRQGVVMPFGFKKPLSHRVASKSLHLAAVWKVG